METTDKVKSRPPSTGRHRTHRHHSRSRSRSPHAQLNHGAIHRDNRRDIQQNNHLDDHGDDPLEKHKNDHRCRRHHHRTDHHERCHTSDTEDCNHRTGNIILPHNARRLDANADYGTFGPLFAYYLRENGGHILLTEAEQKAQIGGGKDNNYAREVQRRWRRFVKRWNRHELSDRWYEPLLYLRVVRAQQNASAVERPVTESVSETGRDDDSKGQENSDENGESDDDNDDDGYGPVLPPNQTLPNKASLAASSSSRSRHLGAPGPSIPSRADLDERRALDDDMQDAERATLRLTRRADRAEQRERLDELAPRAAAGTRERHLEKKRELNEKLRGFRDRSPGGGGLEMDDDELMGGDRGSGRKSAKDLQKDAEAAQARRTYWQQRREEEQRARNEELNERRAQYREREAETMDMLRELARQRFG